MLSRDFEADNNYERDLIARCHKLARIATNVLTFIESQDMMGLMVESIAEPFQRQELEKWWDHHKKAMERETDKKSKAALRQKRVQKALAKLTPTERRLLRIKIKAEGEEA